jgi:serine phosphatase RsbU (regulator of sigma subunit)
MRDWLRKFTMPRAEDEETAHREFVLNVLLLSGIGLLGIYVLIDWAIVAPLRGSLGFGNYLWPPMLLVLLFNYWLVRRGYSRLVTYLILVAITLVTWLSLYGLGSKDISVLLLAFGVALAGILVGLHGAILVLAIDTLAYAALVWAENAGLRPPPVAVSKPVDVIALGLILGALVMMEWLFRFERGRLLSRYREQTARLRAANAALEEANQQAAQQEAWQRELALAREIQLSLLPQYTPTLADFDIKGRSMPAEEVGGDFYTYLPLTGGRLGLAIGDVSGKGMASALYMAIATSVVEAQAASSPDSASLVRDVNNLLYRRVQGTGMNTALLYALFDLTRRQLHVANAGLITPILYHDGAFRYVECYGLPLGAVPGEIYEEERIDLYPGDVILLMTDGIVEAMNRARDLYGFPRLEAVLAECDMSNAQRVVDTVFDSVFEFMEGVPPHDDMTLVAVRVDDRRMPH